MNTLAVHNEVEQKFLEEAFGSPATHPTAIFAREVAMGLRFPHRKMEAWKYTRVAKVLNANLSFQPSTVAEIATPIQGNLVWLQNGIFSPEHSNIPRVQGLTVLPIADMLSNGTVESMLNAVDFSEGDIFKAMNLGSLSGGMYIEAAKDTHVNEALRIVISAHSQSVAQPVILIRAGKNSNVHVTL